MIKMRKYISFFLFFMLLIPLFSLTISFSQPETLTVSSFKKIKLRYGELTIYQNKTNILRISMFPQNCKHYETKQFVSSVFENNYLVKGYYLVQTSGILIKVYNWKTVFYDPDGNKTIVNDERFQVEKYDKVEGWTKIDLYNPFLTDLSNSTHYIIARVFDNPEGKLSVKYILSEGTGLKHEINFTNKSNDKGEYRILMLLNGIEGNVLSYGNVTREITEETIINPDYFHIGGLTENLRRVEADKLKKTVFDKEQDTVKAKTYMGNYTLKKDESLFIDPDSDTWAVSHSYDDGYDYYSLSWKMDRTSNTVFIKSSPTSTNRNHGGVKFNDIGNVINKDSSITTAYITFDVFGTIYDDVDCTITGDDRDDPPQFSNTDLVQTRTMTSASVTWDETSIGSELHDTPELKTIVQELVELEDWGSGDDMAFCFVGDSDTSRTLSVWAYDGSEDEPKLYIEWVGDEVSPTYDNIGTNNTYIDSPTLFYTEWTDETELDYYIFGTNNTGQWINDTEVALSGSNDWSNVTKTLNETIGIRVEWQIWCNDTSNNWNATGLQYLITTGNFTLTIYFDSGIDMFLNGSLQTVNGSSHSYSSGSIVNITSLRRREFIFYKHVYDSTQTLNNTVYLMMNENQTIIAYSIQKTWPQIEYYYYVYYNGSHYVAMNGSNSLIEFYNVSSASAVINDCFNAIPSEGGVVHLKEGSFNTTEPIEPLDNMTLSGEGTTSIINHGFDGNLIYVYEKEHVMFRDFMINGKRSERSSGTCVWIENCDFVTCLRLTIIEIEDYGILCYKSSGTSIQNNVESCTIRGCNEHGIYYNSITRSHILSNYVEQCDKYGIHVYHADVCVISQNVLQDNDIINVSFDTCCFTTFSDNTLYGGVDQTGKIANLYIRGGADNTIIGNTISDDRQHGIRLHETAKRVSIIGNTISSNDKASIYNRGDDILISNNILAQWNRWHSANDSVAIYCEANHSENIIITGNIFINDYGGLGAIHLAQNTNNTLITNNYFDPSNLQYVLNDEGTNTTVIHNIGLADNISLGDGATGIGISSISFLFGLFAFIIAMVSLSEKR